MMDIATFCEKWICCGRVDDDDVVADIRNIRTHTDHTAEELVDYTHDPVVHHVSVQPVRVAVQDNEERMPVMESSPVEVWKGGCIYLDRFHTWAECRERARLVVEKSHAKGRVIPDGVAEWFAKQGSGVIESVEASWYLRSTSHHDCHIATHLLDIYGRWCVAKELDGDAKAIAQASIITEMDRVVDEGWACASHNFPGPAAPATENSRVAVANGEGLVEIPLTQATSVYRLAQDVVEVKRHRRVTKKAPYVRAVVSEVKNRLGLCTPNAANLLAVRRMAWNIMDKHGVRPTHMRELIELVVVGVFVPDKEDLRAARILQSLSIEALREEARDAAPKSAWYGLLHPYNSRRVARVNRA